MGYVDLTDTGDPRAMLTAKEALAIVEQVLLLRNQESTKLWSVLTALRGPDNYELEAKEVTIKIRRAAFPEIAARVGTQPNSSTGWDIANNPMFVSDNPTRQASRIAGDQHFSIHAEWALKALGLEVGE